MVSTDEIGGILKATLQVTARRQVGRRGVSVCAQRAVLHYVLTGRTSQVDLSTATGLSRRTVKVALRALTDAGILNGGRDAI